MSSKIWHGRMQKECARFGLTLNDLKSNPEKLFIASKDFRSWVMQRFNYDQEISWYNKSTSWKNILSDYKSDNPDFVNWTSKSKKVKLDEEYDEDMDDEDIPECKIILLIINYCYR